jgi:hypothetical protein
MKDNNNYCVYAHINKTNCKVYVGMTDNPHSRWLNGWGYQDNKEFFEDIQKYGWDGFSHSILDDYLTYEEAREEEKFYINSLDACNPENGYNRRVG